MDLSKQMGCIFGQAVGDALGFPVEGADPERCKEYIDQVKESEELPARPGYRPGQFTDDTQLALELLESLILNEGYNRDDFASRVAELFASDQIVGGGIATEQAAQRIINGVDLDEVATPPPSAGNGTAMRAAPVGIYYATDHNIVLEIAKKQGQITHADPRCVAGSVVIALAVAYLGNLSNKDDLVPHNFITYLSDQIRPISELFANTLLHLTEILDLELIGAARMISTWGEPDFIDGWKYISPYVIPSVCWSIWAFLKNPTDFKGAIYNSIIVGGDVDTTAAMTGALSGAFLGIEAIPKEWVAKVHDREHWTASSIKNLVAKMV